MPQIFHWQHHFLTWLHILQLQHEVQSHGTWTTEGLSLFEFDGWRTVLQKAEEMDDEKLLRRIRGQDLFAACEAQYHKSCPAKYVQDSNRRSTKTQECESQGDLQKAHHDTFIAITGIVDKEIFHEGKILKLSDLCNMYIDLLQNTRYANPSYRSSKLKVKFEKFYGEKLSFCDLGGFNTYLVYNSNISMDFAIRQVRRTYLQTLPLHCMRK